ncbi:MAG: hypothetical protein KAT30_00620, partial [Candidatus Krumholzibacteria bacterium]|nr:hypothetical protein [Candidatus Krumholzibacteria bacterium]
MFNLRAKLKQTRDNLVDPLRRAVEQGIYPFFPLVEPKRPGFLDLSCMGGLNADGQRSQLVQDVIDAFDQP